MSTDEGQNVVAAPALTCMESVNRIAKLPVVESTIQTATSIYEKVRDYNSVTNWTLSTAENTVNKAVEVGKPYATPVMKNFEGPIKKVDGVLCTGLDYVETKVPAVKLPPKEIILQIYNSTKGYVEDHLTPAVESARAYAQPAVDTARAYAEPAVKTAREIMEPAVEKMRSVVEPMVEPMVENVRHRVDEMLHRNQQTEAVHHDGNESDANTSTNSDIECADCQDALRDANHQQQIEK